MGKAVVIDSGVLVAILHDRDRHHSWAQAHFRAVKPPFLTCDAVISESFFLLNGDPVGTERLCALLDREIVKVAFSSAGNMTDLLKLIRRYADTPMSFADACLVRMSEQMADSMIFTIDSDFQIYRRHGRQIIPVLAPR